MNEISFIGLGKLGLECAEAMTKSGIKINGFDIEIKQSDKIYIHSNLADAIIGCKFIFIA